MNNFWDERLATIRKLEDGWADGDGKAISEDAFKAAHNILAHLYSSENQGHFMRPGIFPLEVNGICIEWSDSREIISLEIYDDECFELLHMTFLIKKSKILAVKDTLDLEIQGIAQLLALLNDRLVNSTFNKVIQ